MKVQGLQIVAGSPDNMAATMQTETKQWAELIKETGIQIPQ